MARTAKQSEAARRNGAKSKGPVTPEGKARSSKNALTHGLSSKAVLLDFEDEAEFNKLLASYLDRWQPADQPERDMVHDIVAARWRINRLLEIEASTIQLEIEEQRELVDAEWNRVDDRSRRALACTGSISSKIDGLSRQESRLHRTIRNATAELRKLQAERWQAERAATPPPPKNRTNEPGNVQTTRPQRVAEIVPIAPAANPPSVPRAPKPVGSDRQVLR